MHKLHLEFSSQCKGTVEVPLELLGQWEKDLHAHGFERVRTYSTTTLSYWRRRTDIPESRRFTETFEEPSQSGEPAHLLRLGHLFFHDPMNVRWVRQDVRHALELWSKGELGHLGSFLEAVLEGDLFTAFGKADAYNQLTMGAICSYAYNHVPLAARGRDNMRAWQDRAIARIRAEVESRR